MHQLMEIVADEFSHLTDCLKRDDRLCVKGFAASAKRLLAAHAVRQLARPLLYVVDTEEDGLKAKDDLSILLEEEVSYLPAWDKPPSEGRSPEVEIVRRRLETLWDLSTGRSRAVVATQRGYEQAVVPRKAFLEAVIALSVGAELERDLLGERLLLLGFESVHMVEDVGQFSIRGGIVDFFSFGAEDPVRVEFFGDSVHSLRTFDVVTQRSKELLQEFNVLPYRETCLTPRTYKRALRSIEDPLEEGSERFLETIHQTLDGILDYLPPETILSVDADLEISEDRPVLLFTQGGERAIIPHPGYQGNLRFFREDLSKYREMDYRLLMLAGGERQRRRLFDIFGDDFPELTILPASLNEGFIYPKLKVACFTDHEIFARPKLRRRKKFTGGVPIDDILSLKKGDICVHVDYGVGRFDGMKRIGVDGVDTDCLVLIYRDGDKLYVPTHQMKQVQRYVGGSGTPPQLTKLGSGSWERVKRRAKRAVEDLTEELLEIYALRQTQEGHAISPDTVWQEELESSFPFDETPDQLKAIEAIKRDMESTKPMDRLICGEVGYGKTEVAIRAAFKTVMDDRQVAVLVPTTILAQQHFNSFTGRLKRFPVEVAMLSRLRSSRENKKTIEKMKNGQVDIVIATHRLLSKDVQVKNLALLIIDEEQRFGVKHKEKIKKMKRLVDCLAMSATPIPRTLYMSLVGIREMTTIETPPPDRLSVATEISTWNDDLIVDACLQEVGRGGQVFFVHNRVQTIYTMAEHLRGLMPELEVGVAHGQLPTAELERVMLDFLNRKYDVLVTSAIVESGVDVPNANTMIVNRADKFGLAQLHQLRGRVGRSDRKAYCYLITPGRGKVTPDARRRLRAIRTFSDLGSGFQLALRDLEIRGAGNILGAEQHGHVNAVGFEFYCKLLERTIKEMKGEEVAAIREPSIALNIDLFIPKEYIPHEEQRIAVYKKLGDSGNEKALDDLRLELEDRFGQMPRKVEALFDAVRIKLAAVDANVDCLTLKDDVATIEFLEGRTPGKSVLRSVVQYPVEFFQTERFGVRLDMSNEDLGFLHGFLLKLSS